MACAHLGTTVSALRLHRCTALPMAAFDANSHMHPLSAILSARLRRQVFFLLAPVCFCHLARAHPGHGSSPPATPLARCFLRRNWGQIAACAFRRHSVGAASLLSFFLLTASANHGSALPGPGFAPPAVPFACRFPRRHRAHDYFRMHVPSAFPTARVRRTRMDAVHCHLRYTWLFSAQGARPSWTWASSPSLLKRLQNASSSWAFPLGHRCWSARPSNTWIPI